MVKRETRRGGEERVKGREGEVKRERERELERKGYKVEKKKHRKK